MRTFLIFIIASMFAVSADALYYEEDYVSRGFMQRMETTHPGARHHLVVVTKRGDRVELEDGSVWRIRATDRYKVDRNGWLPGDEVHIKKSGLFSIYRHVMVNPHLRSENEVEVEMEEGPIVGGLYTYYIVDIDYYNCRVLLSDGSQWEVNHRDSGTLDDWYIGEPVIHGVNDSWFTAEKYLLINFRSEENIRADCVR